MRPFRVLDAAAVPLDESNVDTDQLAPVRFLSLPVSAELLLHDRRFERDGTPRHDFVLNDPAYACAEIIVSRSNFGAGSSREYAVLALPAAGFRCVVAAGFGDIFSNNCLQNGVLPVMLDEPAISTLLHALCAHPGLHVTVDLPTQTVSASGCGPYPFAINAMRKRCFLEGLDDIALTERSTASIDAFEADYYRASPWLS
jgi:3-isopropylmalate/(R)-2-methylmalate dehydratase small subunit